MVRCELQQNHSGRKSKGVRPEAGTTRRITKTVRRQIMATFSRKVSGRSEINDTATVFRGYN